MGSNILEKAKFDTVGVDISSDLKIKFCQVKIVRIGKLPGLFIYMC